MIVVLLIVVIGSLLLWGFVKLAEYDARPIEVPVFTEEMLSPNPVSTRTEAKKIYRFLLERYGIVDPIDVSNHVDMLSKDIEAATWGCQDDVNYQREGNREIKDEMRDVKQQLRKIQKDEFYDQGSEDDEDCLLKEIEQLELQLKKAEIDLQDAIEERDSFKRDKRDYIAYHLNSLAHKDGCFNTKYFIYKDAKGAITARCVTNCGTSLKYIYGRCKKSHQMRSFRKDRVLEFASNMEELMDIRKKHNIAPESRLP